MLHSNMESTPFWAGASPFSSTPAKTIGGQKKAAPGPNRTPLWLVQDRGAYQVPVFGMLAQGSWGGR